MLHITKSKGYNGTMAESLKVPADQFKAVIRALLNTLPMPMATISPKRPKAKRRAKKRA